MQDLLRSGLARQAHEGRRDEGKHCLRRPFVELSNCRVSMGSADAHVQSTAMRRPRPQALGALGAPYLTLGFAAKPNPSAPWVRGLLSAFWERGSPDLPACGPRRGYASRPVWPIFINKAFKTLARGQASRGRRRKTSSGAASPGRLTRGGEIKARLARFS